MLRNKNDKGTIKCYEVRLTSGSKVHCIGNEIQAFTNNDDVREIITMTDKDAQTYIKLRGTADQLEIRYILPDNECPKKPATPEDVLLINLQAKLQNPKKSPDYYFAKYRAEFSFLTELNKDKKKSLDDTDESKPFILSSKKHLQN